LYELSNSDKHNNPQRTFPQSYGKFSFDLDRCVDFVAERIEIANPFPAVFHSGAEIAAVHGRITGPNPQMFLKLQGSIAIAIEPGIWLGDALNKIGATAVKVVSEVEPFL
jgi:hypothetical protein